MQTVASTPVAAPPSVPIGAGRALARYAASRLGFAIPTVLIILMINFVVIHTAPGDPLAALIGEFPVPDGYAEKIRAEFGLDLPLWGQLWRYLVHLAQGDLGFSFANRQPVLTLLAGRVPLTLLLMLPSLILASIVGICIAVYAAPRAGGAVDHGLTALVLVGYSVPIFWLGQLLTLLFAVKLGWLPAQGMMSARTPPQGWALIWDVARHMVLPLGCITAYFVAIVARVSKASVMVALAQDFVLTASAKGLSRRRVLWRHVLPNAAVPILTVIGFNFGYCLTGAILVETVFAWPGLGSLFLASITNRDYPVLQGLFLFVSIVVVLANLATDILCAVLDPRVRRSILQHG